MGDLAEQERTEVRGPASPQRAQGGGRVTTEPDQVGGRLVRVVHGHHTDDLACHLARRGAGGDEVAQGSCDLDLRPLGRFDFARHREGVEELANASPRFAQGFVEGLGVVETEGDGEGFARRSLRWQGVGLVAGAHVDAVLDPPEQGPVALEGRRLPVGHEPEAEEPVERFDRPRHPELGVPPSPYELQRLYEELGLADAAPSELDVTLRIDRELSSAAREHLGHLAPDPRVHRAAVDERSQRVEQLAAEDQVPRDGACPRKGASLPRSTKGLVVALGAREGVHQGAACSFRTQAQVHTKA